MFNKEATLCLDQLLGFYFLSAHSTATESFHLPPWGGGGGSSPTPPLRPFAHKGLAPKSNRVCWHLVGQAKRVCALCVILPYIAQYSLLLPRP